MFYKHKLVTCYEILTVCADGIVNARRTTMDDLLYHERPAVDEIQVFLSQFHYAISVTRLLRRRWDATKAYQKWCHETRCKCRWTAKSCACWQFWVDSYVYTGHSATIQQATDIHINVHIKLCQMLIQGHTCLSRINSHSLKTSKYARR